MRVIDRDGRLFGRLNIIDLAVLIVAMASVATLVYAYTQLRGLIPLQSRQALERFEYHWVDVMGWLRGVDPETVSLITPGDQQVVPPGQPIATVVAVGIPEPDVFELSWSGSEIIRLQSLSKLRVPVVLRLLCGVKNDQLFYQGRRVVPETRIYFETDHYAVSGLVKRLVSR